LDKNIVSKTLPESNKRKLSGRLLLIKVSLMFIYLPEIFVADSQIGVKRN